MQGARVQSLVGEIEPCKLTVHRPQLNTLRATTRRPKILCTATKTQLSQTNKVLRRQLLTSIPTILSIKSEADFWTLWEKARVGCFEKNSMCIIYSETDHQPRWDAWDKCSGLVHWEDPEESGGEGGGRGDQDGKHM